MGAHTRALDTALRVAEEHDVQVALHSDGLNECLSVEDTLRVLEGRTVHAFHIEGCGGGHVPNVLKMASDPRTSSAPPPTPRCPRPGRGRRALRHDRLRPRPKTVLPGDAAMPSHRTRAATTPAEDVLHYLCDIGVASSDAQGIGRPGETLATAPSPWPAGVEAVRRPGRIARAAGASCATWLQADHQPRASPTAWRPRLGSIEVGKRADMVLWRPEVLRRRSQNAPDEARDRQAAIEGAWHRDLVALLAEGISRGEFRPVDPDRFASRLRALLDGFAIHVAIGLRGTDREQVLGHVREFLADGLLAPS
ncbi:Urease subunit alpha [Streptomyces tendae]